jgi:hypothetical protein
VADRQAGSRRWVTVTHRATEGVSGCHIHAAAGPHRHCTSYNNDMHKSKGGRRERGCDRGQRRRVDVACTAPTPREDSRRHNRQHRQQRTTHIHTNRIRSGEGGVTERGPCGAATRAGDDARRGEERHAQGALASLDTAPPPPPPHRSHTKKHRGMHTTRVQRRCRTTHRRASVTQLPCGRDVLGGAGAVRRVRRRAP